MSEIIVKRYGNPVVGVLAGTQRGLLKTVNNGANQAKALCPVDQGLARNSIGYSAEVSGNVINGGYNQDPGEKSNTFLESRGSGTVAYYGSANSYTPYLEGGTRKMVAQPHITPSADILSKEKTVAEVKKELNDQMVKEVKSGTKATRIK